MRSTTMSGATVHHLRPIAFRPGSPDIASCLGRAVEVGVEPLRDIAALEAAWKDLEERATHSFFLSWLWIGTWLRQLPERAEPHVLIARDCGRIVGLAIVCRRGTWRLGPRPRTRWLLNETGDASFDRLCI